jgi:hypothetical protein
MKLIETIVGAIILVSLFLISLHFHIIPLDNYSNDIVFSKQSNLDKILIDKLLGIIEAQNKTIGQLHKVIESQKETTLSTSFIRNETQKNASYLCPPQKSSFTSMSSFGAIKSFNGAELSTKFDQDCENRYGMTLIDEWRKSEQIWCEDKIPNANYRSTLKCFPYHQQHKKKDDRGPDLFCEATNFVIDFSKV